MILIFSKKQPVPNQLPFGCQFVQAVISFVKLFNCNVKHKRNQVLVFTFCINKSLFNSIFIAFTTFPWVLTYTKFKVTYIKLGKYLAIVVTSPTDYITFAVEPETVSIGRCVIIVGVKTSFNKAAGARGRRYGGGAELLHVYGKLSRSMVMEIEDHR